MERAILHCDMNNFYATVEEKYNPQLARIPFAVCGDPQMRHSIVMAKNSLAKKLGIITGISYYQARKICPGLGYVKADYFRYLEEAKAARRVYLKYTDTILPYGMDESWIVLEPGTTVNEARQIADLIRVEIKYAMGLSASVGVSFNYMFSKLGSDYKKPNATTVITRENYREIVWPLPASDLLFVGAQRKKLLLNAGYKTIGDLAAARPEHLTALLGKVGRDLWMFANGDDRQFNPVTDSIGSIGNAITPPEDLRTNEDASAIIYLLVTSIAARLRRHSLKAGCISVHTRDSAFKKVIRQTKLINASDSVNVLFNKAFGLFIKHYPWEKPLRSVGVRADNLDSNEQLSLIDMDSVRLDFDIDRRVRNLTARLGRLDVERTATLAL